MSNFPPSITLRLGLFFDGTANNQGNSAITHGCLASSLEVGSEQADEFHRQCAALGYTAHGVAPDGSYGNDPSNVARLYSLYPDEAGDRIAAEADAVAVKVYLEGIGTRTGAADSRLGEATGRGPTGVVARVEQMPALVMQQLRKLRNNNPGLTIGKLEIDLFGFSRGAAAARHCANDLLSEAASGLARALPSGSPLLAPGFSWRHRLDFEINFIGLLDTVAAIAEPFPRLISPHKAANAGVNLYLAPGIARTVVQLVASDECRHNFPLTATDHDIEMPGSHSDIGGGYLPLITEKLLLSKPESSLCAATIANEQSQAYRRALDDFKRTEHRWRSCFAPQELNICTWETPVPSHVHGDVPQKRVFAALAGQRKVRGELSLVYLRIMRELAVQAGVGFDAVPTTPDYALPAELEPIAASLLAYAMARPFSKLSVAEQSLLRRRYIHLSANWKAAIGKGSSDFDVVFINRPEEGGCRRRFRNE